MLARKSAGQGATPLRQRASCCYLRAWEETEAKCNAVPKIINAVHQRTGRASTLLAFLYSTQTAKMQARQLSYRVLSSQGVEGTRPFGLKKQPLAAKKSKRGLTAGGWGYIIVPTLSLALSGPMLASVFLPHVPYGCPDSEPFSTAPKYPQEARATVSALLSTIWIASIGVDRCQATGITPLRELS